MELVWIHITAPMPQIQKHTNMANGNTYLQTTTF